MANQVVKSFQEGRFLVEISEVSGVPLLDGAARFVACIRRVDTQSPLNPFDGLQLDEMEELESLLKGAVFSTYCLLGWAMPPREM